MSPATVPEPAGEREQANRSLAVLCNEQTRAMLAQNAASLSRLAAAISHEMNTPLGALRSAVDTFAVMIERNAPDPASLRLDLLRAMRDSANRLSTVVQRMQRFTNLNRAEVQRTCLNGLIRDVVELLDPEVRASVRIDLEQQDALPYVISHPQQLSAVFSLIVGNAIDSLGEDGRIRIVTRSANGVVHAEVHDNGRGIPASALPDIFEPSFQESGGRMASGNWNLFSCRHLIESHGGAIHISSAEGQGTSVHIALPAEPAAHG